MPKDSAGLEEMLIVNTLTRIDGKLDKLDDRMDGMSTTLVKQQDILDEHVKRSNLLEQKIDLETKKIVEALPKEVEAQIKLQRTKFIINALKVGGVIAGLGGGGWGGKQLITALLKFWGE
jgi:predicted oxidoreductase